LLALRSNLSADGQDPIETEHRAMHGLVASVANTTGGVGGGTGGSTGVRLLLDITEVDYMHLVRSYTHVKKEEEVAQGESQTRVNTIKKSEGIDV
jgi:hypothetical protein